MKTDIENNRECQQINNKHKGNTISQNVFETLTQNPDNNGLIKIDTKEVWWEFLLENQINKFFESEEFKEFFYLLDEYGKGEAIWLVIIYSVAFQDETKPMDYSDCIDFVKECFYTDSFGRNDILVNYISKKLWIDRSDANYEQILKDYILEKIFKNWYVFHGFSSIAEESIRKNWLSTSMRFTEKEEVLEVWNIMRKYRKSFDHFYKNWEDYNSICFDIDTRNIWMYANGSPERFWLFIRNCFENYEPKWWWNDDNQYDYDRIKLKMQNFFKIKDVSEEDKIKILDFFEENRKKYWKYEPRLAMIKRLAINDDIQFRESLDLDTLVNYMFFWVNSRLYENISSDDIKIVKLPKPLP